MISNRRDGTRAAGLAVVAVFVALAVILIVFKLQEKKSGSGVTAVPLTGVKGPATKPVLTAAIDGKGAAPGLDRDVEIVVVDALSKHPIAGAELTIDFYVHDDPKLPPGVYTRREVTDEKGRGWVILPETDPVTLRIKVKKEGYVSRSTTSQQGDGKGILGTYQFELEAGTSIGGIVHDEQGNPIAGVEVVCYSPGDGSEGRRQGDFWEASKGRSDEQGRWRCDGIAPNLKEVMIKLTHPDFISDQANGFTSKPPMEEMRAMKGFIVMKRGLTINGLVLDEAGKPIANASVTEGAMRTGTTVSVRTDGEGRFALKNWRPGPAVLTVTAKTYAPEMRDVVAAREMAPVEFRLAKGNILRGKVVDVEGKAIAGARVGAHMWRKRWSLQWAMNTGADGSFVWTDAPADQVVFDINQVGYQYLQQPMSASEKECVITLRRPLKVHGMVVDSETGKAVENFRAVPGSKDFTRTMWNEGEAMAGRDGQYQIQFVQSNPQNLVKIEAPGYLPALSPAYRMDQSDVVFDVKLKKGSGPAGMVRTADGKAAAGVDVGLAGRMSNLHLRNGAIVRNGAGAGLLVQTDAEGKFEFPPQVEDFVIVAAGDGGYGKVTAEQLKASSEIKLQQWGRVVGKMMIGSKPAANDEVYLSYDFGFDPAIPRMMSDYHVTTDKDGNFAFERAAPLEARASRRAVQLKGRYSSYGYSHPQQVMVKPGETVTVQVGGVGRPVIGRIVVPSDPVSQAWDLSAGMSTKQPPRPKDFDGWSAQKKQEWYKQYQQSDEFKTMLRNRKSYGMTIADDGSFRAEDVLPGVYELNVSATDRAHDGRQQELMASAQIEVTIGEIPGGQTDEPLDVGSLELKKVK